MKTIENADQEMGPSFIVNPNIKAKAKNVLRFAVNGSLPLWKNGMLGDLPTGVTTLMPNNLSKGSGNNLSNIFITVPSEICVVNFGLPAIALSTEGATWFQADQTAYRIVAYADVGLIRAGVSHALLKDIITEK